MLPTYFYRDGAVAAQDARRLERVQPRDLGSRVGNTGRHRLGHALLEVAAAGQLPHRLSQPVLPVVR